MPFVFVGLENLAEAIQTDPVALLHCERMIRRLKLDGWPRWIRSQVEMGLEVERIRVSRKLVGEPPEIRWLVHAVSALEEFQIASEVLLAKRNPDAVPKRSVATVNRNLEDAANEEFLVLNDTSVSGDHG